jgi:mRNA interferase RelE/StbE
MSKYSVVLSNKAKKQLDKLSDYIALPIIQSIGELENDPRPAGCKKLKGREGYRIRTGNYRIIYDIIDHQLIVDVITLGHRKDVYE